MKFLPTWAAVVLLPLSSFSQPSAIVSASGTQANSQVKVDWTLGDVFVETMKANSIEIATGVGSINSVFIVTGDLVVAESDVQVYPIPFLNEIYVKSASSNHDKFEFQFFDTSGKKIILPSEQSEDTMRIDASTIGSGSYLILVRRENELTYTPIKLIKQ